MSVSHVRCSRWAALLAGLVVAGCSISEPPPAPAPTPSTTTTPTGRPAKDPAAARTAIAAGAVMIDVRTAEEYAEDHLPRAVNIPIAEFDGRLAEVRALARDVEAPLVVYCASGARATRAKRALEAAGYTHVINGRGLDDLR